MVAYSFHPLFGTKIAKLQKRQTCRPDRKRHAKPGENIQLYTGMRTKACRKVLSPDPICVASDPVVIDWSGPKLRLELCGFELPEEASLNFAVDDGFGDIGNTKADAVMRRWFAMHGKGDAGRKWFTGRRIGWKPQPAFAIQK